jgi:tryptophan-rich sensory protein
MLQLLSFVIAVVGIGWLIGATNLRGAWYACLAKPASVPPNWVFPVAIMIAVGRKT